MSIDYISKAINVLAVAQSDTLRYSYVGNCKTQEDFNKINGVENFEFTWSNVQAKATELEQEDTDKKDTKVSAYRKNGLTDDEILAIDPNLEGNL